MASIQGVYLALFGRPADPVGLAFFNEVTKNGADLTAIGDLAATDEYQSRFVGLTTAQIINSIYQSLFGRDAELEGLAWWADALARGVYNINNIAIAILDGAQGTDKEIVETKLETARKFTESLDTSEEILAYTGMAAAERAAAFMATVTEQVPSDEQIAGLIDDLMALPPPSTSFTLTTGTDNIVLGAADVVTGETGTLNQSDTITGPGTANLFFTDTTASGNLSGVGVVNINPNGTVVVNAENWTDIGQVTVNEVDNGTDFLFDQIQGSVPNIALVDVQAGSKVTLHYDGQDLNAADQVATVAVKEYNGVLELRTDANSATKTIELEVLDTAGFESTIESLTGQETENLKITGGEDGIDFEIVAPLDATITKLDATGLLSNAKLNVSASTTTMDVDLGPGDDVLDVGDTLVDDSISGGEGDDRVLAEFVDQATRTPTMDGVETLEASFAATVTFDGANVDDLATIDLLASKGRADFNRMDSTLATVNVLGDLEQGFEVDYDGQARAELTVNIEGETENIGNAGNDYGIQAINADLFVLNHNGSKDVEVNEGIRVDDSFSGRYTTEVKIVNNSDADLTIRESNQANSVIVDGNTVERLTIESTARGDIFAPPLGNEDDLMGEAASLQHYKVASATDSDIVAGRIGDDEEAEDLETVTIAAGVSSNLWIGAIDADGGTGAATIDQIAVSADSSANVQLVGNDWLQAASVNKMTVDVAEGATFTGTGVGGRVQIDLEAQANGSLLEVSGAGNVTGFNFDDSSFSTIDASGLTQDGIDIIHTNPGDAAGIMFIGSEQGDFVIATDDDDELIGNGGNDNLQGRGGDDKISGGGGDDFLFGEAGNDVIDGGAGNDFIEGGANAGADPSGDILAGAIGDVLTGGAGNDIFHIDLFGNDTGKSTNGAGQIMQDVITDFSMAGDVLELDVLFPDNTFAIAVYEDDGAPVNFAGLPVGDIQIVARVGDYNADGTFNQKSDGDDVQLLFNTHGVAFNFALALINDGGDHLFQQAEHEVGLLGAANQLGSIASADFVFV